MTIKLNDILRLSEDEIEVMKARFLTTTAEGTQNVLNVLDAYVGDREEVSPGWFLFNFTKKTFQVGDIFLGFIRMGEPDKWLLTTICKVTKDLDRFNAPHAFEYEELEQYRGYFGRLIVKWKSNVGMAISGTLKLKPRIEQLEVLEILPDIYDGQEFPGFDNIRLSYSELASIIHRGKKDWIAALSSQRAVYLITDMKGGYQYVGSAAGDDEGLLQRWRNYIDNGHGGNKRLIDIREKEGFDYIKKNFQYSVLEVYSPRVDKAEILKRESWWKETLGSRSFGLNCN